MFPLLGIIELKIAQNRITALLVLTAVFASLFKNTLESRKSGSFIIHKVHSLFSILVSEQKNIVILCSVVLGNNSFYKSQQTT